MCRNIKTLFNFEPPATEEEIRAAALQFVRKLSGFNPGESPRFSRSGAALLHSAETCFLGLASDPRVSQLAPASPVLFVWLLGPQPQKHLSAAAARGGAIGARAGAAAAA